MVRVSGTPCDHPGCTKQPVFNLPSLPRGRFCSSHRLPGMVDVVSKHCTRCHRVAHFGPPGQSPSVCATHKTPGHIYQPTRKCVICGTPATHGPAPTGTNNLVAVRCGAHAAATDRCGVHVPCSRCRRVLPCDIRGLCFQFCACREAMPRTLSEVEAMLQGRDRGFLGEVRVEDGVTGEERVALVFAGKKGKVGVVVEVHDAGRAGAGVPWGGAMGARAGLVRAQASLGGAPVHWMHVHLGRIHAQGHRLLLPLKERLVIVDTYIDRLRATPTTAKSMGSVVFLFFDDGHVHARVDCKPARSSAAAAAPAAPPRRSS